MPRHIRPWPSLAALVLILVAVLVPGNDLPDNPGIPGLDKIAHFILFAMLATAISRDFGPMNARKAIAAIAFSLALATGTEAMQLAVPGRSAEILDAAADAAGFLAGLAAWAVMSRLGSPGQGEGA